MKKNPSESDLVMIALHEPFDEMGFDWQIMVAVPSWWNPDKRRATLTLLEASGMFHVSVDLAGHPD